MNVEAIATRSGQWWAVEVPAVPGLFTQARRLDQVPDIVIEAAALLDVDVDVVVVTPQLDHPDAKLIADARDARTAAASAERIASAASRAAVQQLRSAGLTVRDVGRVLGLSAQRVSVLDRPVARAAPMRPSRDDGGFTTAPPAA